MDHNISWTYVNKKASNSFSTCKSCTSWTDLLVLFAQSGEAWNLSMCRKYPFNFLPWCKLSSSIVISLICLKDQRWMLFVFVICVVLIFHKLRALKLIFDLLSTIMCWKTGVCVFLWIMEFNELFVSPTITFSSVVWWLWVQSRFIGSCGSGGTAWSTNHRVCSKIPDSSCSCPWLRHWTSIISVTLGSVM